MSEKTELPKRDTSGKSDADQVGKKFKEKKQ